MMQRLLKKMSIKQQVAISNIDEFGRDMSLRNPKRDSSVSRFKGMSWADICDTIEEEAEIYEEKIKQEQAVWDYICDSIEKEAEINRKMCEEIMRQEETAFLRVILSERRILYQNGEYDLEEGEELEL
jgi:hypothetical protein